MVLKVKVVLLLEITHFPDPEDIVLDPCRQLEDVRLGLETCLQILQHLFPRPGVKLVTDRQECALLGRESLDELADGIRFRRRLADDGSIPPVKTRATS
jgi:hypothetical protein